MNPFCPYCKVRLVTKFRAWTDTEFGSVEEHAGKYWECPECGRMWKKGYSPIMKGTELKKRIKK